MLVVLLRGLRRRQGSAALLILLISLLILLRSNLAAISAAAKQAEHAHLREDSRHADGDHGEMKFKRESWCMRLREDPPRQPCWGKAELKRRDAMFSKTDGDEQLRWGATNAAGEPIFPSEGGQDRWLWKHHFKWLDRPVTYADFGSNHYLHTSNTFFLDVCAGARGVCVEANEQYVPEYAQHGRSCKVMHTCLSDQPETVTFAAWGTRGGVASTNKSLKRGSGDQSRIDSIEMTCSTGAAVLAAPPAMTHVDWLDLDAEGHELKILQGIDWAATRIDIVTVEANDVVVRKFLEERGYRLERRIHYDDVFLASGFSLLRPPSLRAGEDDDCVVSE